MNHGDNDRDNDNSGCDAMQEQEWRGQVITWYVPKYHGEQWPFTEDQYPVTVELQAFVGDQ